MQPKDKPSHIRIQKEPTQKQKQRQCRLYGKDLISVEEASRYWSITYYRAAEQVRNE